MIVHALQKCVIRIFREALPDELLKKLMNLTSWATRVLFSTTKQ